MMFIMMVIGHLFLLTPLTHLKRHWINSGTIKILFMITEHSYREPEVGVKFCMINFSKLVYCKVFLCIFICCENRYKYAIGSNIAGTTRLKISTNSRP